MEAVQRDPGYLGECCLWNRSVVHMKRWLSPDDIALVIAMVKGTDAGLFYETGRLVVAVPSSVLARMTKRDEKDIEAAQARLAKQGMLMAVKGRYQFMPNFLNRSMTRIVDLRPAA